MARRHRGLRWRQGTAPELFLGGPSAGGHGSGLTGAPWATLDEHYPAADRDDREHEAAGDSRIAPVKAVTGTDSPRNSRRRG
ncbi:MAG: hypothetical protein JO120_03265 [Solirubrobacterales bacterium]|nr:hypothetical protein [Solirubrobacterales bacterium]